MSFRITGQDGLLAVIKCFIFTHKQCMDYLMLEQFVRVIYIPIYDEKLISINLVFATVDRYVTGAPGCPLA